MVGDIVWAPVRFTDLSGGKVRPMLVLADVRDAHENDWIVCEITGSSIQHARAIVIAQADLQSGQLRLVSQVRPDRIFTLNEGVFRNTAGRLNAVKMAEISAAVRALF